MSLAATCLLGLSLIQTPAATPARAGSLVGEFREIPGLSGPGIEGSRDLTIWLPPGFVATSSRRYPVLLMLDGQNLFDGTKSFIPGQEWRVDETATMLINAGVVEPLIIVGITNGNERRINDYTPTPSQRGGGNGDGFGRYLTETVIPRLQKDYRVSSFGLAGASLGGLITAYLGLRHPSAFDRLGVFSPSVWWDGRYLLRQLDGSRPARRQRIWLDMGSREGADALTDAKALRDAYVRKGWRVGKDLAYAEETLAEHNEIAWRGRFGPMLMFLYPAKP